MPQWKIKCPICSFTSEIPAQIVEDIQIVFESAGLICTSNEKITQLKEAKDRLLRAGIIRL